MNNDPFSPQLLLDAIANFINGVASYFLPGDVELSFWTWAIIFSAIVLFVAVVVALINKYKWW